jgi:endonuclease/exonuclease/phosphatase (EEP) superfamily protein YafD
VLAGDLNTSPWSPTNRRLLAGLGLVDTAAGPWPPATRLWRELGLPRQLGAAVDRIAVSRGVAVERFVVGPEIGSDHLPVLADLRLPPR